jgi:hypothetical protein
MKLEIELDLNKIDYDAINRQILEKIDSMDLRKEYSIESKIKDTINENVNNAVANHIKTSIWGGLTIESKMAVEEEFRSKIRDIIKPYIDEIFNKLPADELNKLISDLIPKVIMDQLISNVSSSLYSFQETSRITTNSICEERIRNMLHL